MKKRIVIQIGYDTYFAVPAGVDAGPVIAALSTSEPYRTEGYGQDRRFVPSESSEIKVEFVSDELFKERTPIETALSDDAKRANERWSNEYQAHAKTKEALKAAEAKLTLIGTELKEKA